MADKDLIVVSDLIAYGVQAEWHEAIAIVQEVCDQIIRHGGESAPDAEQIRLDAAGTVIVASTRSSNNAAVAHLGHILSGLLQGARVPAELRLTISQVTGSAPLFNSVGELSHRLSYFERPDRGLILRGLYQRLAPVIAAAKARGATAAAPLNAAASSPKAVREQTSRGPAKRFRKRLLVGAIAGALLAVTGIVAWMQIGRESLIFIRTSAMLTRTEDSLGTLVVSGVTAARGVLRDAGLIGPAPPPAPSPATNKPDTPKIRRPALRSSAKRVPETYSAEMVARAAESSSGTRSAESSSGTQAAESTSGTQAAESTPRTPDVAGGSGDTVAAIGDDRTEPAPKVETGQRIYSTDDADVQPPTLLWPQLPSVGSDRPFDEAEVGVGLVELLVNERGTVERLKFLTPPGRFGERMLLSAMKAWRYQPAIKDGRPVRFLHRVKLIL